MYFVCFIIFVVYYYPAVLLLLLILGLFFIGYKLLSKSSDYSGSTVVKNYPDKNYGNYSKANYRSGYVCDEMEWDEEEDFDCDDCDWYEEPVKSEKKSFFDVERHSSGTADSGKLLLGGLPYGDGEIFFENDGDIDSALDAVL